MWKFYILILEKLQKQAVIEVVKQHKNKNFSKFNHNNIFFDNQFELSKELGGRQESPQPW